MKFLPFVWSNLKRRKLRTTLTILSVMVAFLLFGFLVAIKQALAGGVEMAGADRLVVRHKVSLIMSLPESYQARICNIPGVAGAAHMSWFGGVYQDPKNFFAQMPVVPEEFLQMYPEYLLPAEAKAAWLRTRTGAVIGRKLANRYGFKVGDKIPLQASIWTRKSGGNTWEFDVVGIFDGAKKGTDTTQLLFRYDYFDEARAFGKGSVGWYAVRVKDPAQAPEIAQKIDAEFANSPYETKAETEGAFVQAFAKQIGDIGTIMIGILSAVFFTILLVAGNTMAQSVRERTEELGVLKAMGFNDGQVLGLVLGESCLISMVGGILGLGIACIIIEQGDPTHGSLPMFFLPKGQLLTGAVLFVALGIATGILPAWQAKRLQIAEALRRN